MSHQNPDVKLCGILSWPFIFQQTLNRVLGHALKKRQMKPLWDNKRVNEHQIIAGELKSRTQKKIIQGNGMESDGNGMRTSNRGSGVGS